MRLTRREFLTAIGFLGIERKFQRKEFLSLLDMFPDETGEEDFNPIFDPHFTPIVRATVLLKRETLYVPEKETEVKKKVMYGSGFVYKNRRISTNYHVAFEIEDRGVVSNTVYLVIKGREIALKVLESSRKLDSAILGTIEDISDLAMPKDYEFFRHGALDSIKLEDILYVLGYQIGANIPSLNTGIVFLPRDFHEEGDYKHYDTVFFSSAGIGNSGAPVIRAVGEGYGDIVYEWVGQYHSIYKEAERRLTVDKGLRTKQSEKARELIITLNNLKQEVNVANAVLFSEFEQMLRAA